MPAITDLITTTFKRLRCCPPPAPPQGLQAAVGGGSGEAIVTWLPGPANIASYRVYRHKGDDQLFLLALVLPGALGNLIPGRIGIVDAPDYWPWPTGLDGDEDRTYRVTTVATTGLESGLSAPVTVVGPFS